MDGETKKNPFDTGAENPGYDETGQINEMDRFPSSSSRRGSEDINNPYHHRTYEETSFTTGGDERTPLLDEVFQENRQEAAKILKSKFLRCEKAQPVFLTWDLDYDSIQEENLGRGQVASSSLLRSKYSI